MLFFQLSIVQWAWRWVFHQNQVPPSSETVSHGILHLSPGEEVFSCRSPWFRDINEILRSIHPEMHFHFPFYPLEATGNGFVYQNLKQLIIDNFARLFENFRLQEGYKKLTKSHCYKIPQLKLSKCIGLDSQSNAE